MNSNADFFLLNPNGIVFGPNASLALGGSFLATTAETVNFDQEAFFSTNLLDSSSLLAISTPTGLQFGENPGAISNFSRSETVIGQTVGLQVSPNQTFALIGGPISIPGGQIVSPQSHLELGAVAANSEVGLSSTQAGYRFSYDRVNEFQDIEISQLATLDSSSLTSGLIQLRGRNISITGGSQVLARTLRVGMGDGLDSINIQASERFELSGTAPLDGPLDERLSFFQIFVPQQSRVEASLLGGGEGGDVRIQAKQVRVRDGAQLATFLQGEGRSGSLLIQASESVESIGHGELLGFGTTFDAFAQLIGIDPLAIAQGLSSTTITASSLPLSSADGRSGNLEIDTARLIIRDGGVTNTSPFGPGSAGILQITAREFVELNGTDRSEISPSGLTIAALLGGTGLPGELRINTPRLRILNGARLGLDTTSDRGGLGLINASESTEIRGRSATGAFRSGITALSGIAGIGGELELTTGQLTIADGGEISAFGGSAFVEEADFNADTVQGGTVNIRADNVVLDNQAQIITGVLVGLGGNINLQVNNNFLMRRNSLLSAQAGTTGNGGNITLSANFIVGVSEENSDIIANAVSGQGGNINLTANGILGFEVRDQLTPLSDINASSQVGIDGTVNLDTPEIEPANDLQVLPNNFVDGSQLIAQNLCRDGQGSEFIVTGRGGLPQTPLETLQPQSGWEDWRFPESLHGLKTESGGSALALVQPSLAKSQLLEQPASLVKPPGHKPGAQPWLEARGWQRSPQGQIQLTTAQATSEIQVSHGLNCRQWQSQQPS